MSQPIVKPEEGKMSYHDHFVLLVSKYAREYHSNRKGLCGALITSTVVIWFITETYRMLSELPVDHELYLAPIELQDRAYMTALWEEIKSWKEYSPSGRIPPERAGELLKALLLINKLTEAFL
jgi:hypothetical protein